MNQYYLHDGQNQIGPFSLEELKARNINKDTHIWKNGMDDWTKAGDIDELKNLFINTPPPFNVSSNGSIPSINKTQDIHYTKTLKTGIWIGRHPVIFVLILIAIAVGGIVIYKNSSSNVNYYSGGTTDSAVEERTPAQLKAALLAKERENPLHYLTSKFAMRKNLIGETVIEGSVSNSATIATFKDVLIQFTFLSKTKAEISKQNFTFYEIIEAQKEKSIGKFKTFAPDGTADFIGTILSATPVE